MKKIARKERQHSHDENDNNFTQFSYHPCGKNANKCPAPSSDSNDSSSCKEAVEGPSLGKEGGKKPKLAKKKKAKTMKKENDLVVSSEGSESQLSEAEHKKLPFLLNNRTKKILF